jgi:hypothetical protein
MPRIELLGVFPTWEGPAAQVLTMGAIALGFWLGRRRTAAVL